MTTTLDGVQLDLFGEVERALTRAERAAAEAAAAADADADLRAEWERAVRQHPDGTPVVWVAPWDCADGTPKGTEQPGWRCPHCARIEANEYHLGASHCMDWDDWSRRARAGRPRSHCSSLDLLDIQQTSLWGTTTCRGGICTTCGRRNTADYPGGGHWAVSGDLDGEHCSCGCHAHVDCTSTPDRCVALILDLRERYRAHRAAHPEPRCRWTLGDVVLVDGVAHTVVALTWPRTVLFTRGITARTSTRGDTTKWIETWDGKGWSTDHEVVAAPRTKRRKNR